MMNLQREDRSLNGGPSQPLSFKHPENIKSVPLPKLCVPVADSSAENARSQMTTRLGKDSACLQGHSNGLQLRKHRDALSFVHKLVAGQQVSELSKCTVCYAPWGPKRSGVPVISSTHP